MIGLGLFYLHLIGLLPHSIGCWFPAVTSRDRLHSKGNKTVSSGGLEDTGGTPEVLTKRSIIFQIKIRLKYLKKICTALDEGPILENPCWVQLYYVDIMNWYWRQLNQECDYEERLLVIQLFQNLNNRFN